MSTPPDIEAQQLPRTSSSSNGTSSTSSSSPYVDSDMVLIIEKEPTLARQPWPYVLQKGQFAWARGGNKIWRLVLVLDVGSQDIIDEQEHIVYTVGWICDGFTLRGTFSPMIGDIKPDEPDIETLIRAKDEACSEPRDTILRGRIKRLYRGCFKAWLVEREY
ncbi:hypothetical protein OF83DRAFT_1168749 [Amylostereum chailletii]|nr:hypothetical protein OF83DRAFT_1168749 [Amylostereum chailletii]